MKKKLVKTVLVILVLIISTSCWNKRELNELAIAMALGIDKVDDKNIRLSVQVVLPQEVKDPSYYTPVTIYSEEAETMFEVFRKITTMAPRKIYLPHFRIVVISEAVAREGILDLLDMLIRDHEFRSDFYIIIAKDGSKAEDILKTVTPFDKIPANEKFASLNVSEAAWAPTHSVNLDELLTKLVTDGIESTLTGIRIIGDKGEKGETKENVETLDTHRMLQFNDLAVFKEDKLVGWLHQEESKGYNYIMGNIISTVARVPCPKGDELVVEIKSANGEIIPELKDGKPTFEIKIQLEANVAEVKCNIDLKDPKVIKELEEGLKQQNKEKLEKAVYAARDKFKSDIFGFGNAFHKKYPKHWKKIKDDWYDIFPTVDVSYNVETKIKLTGSLNDTFLKK